MKVISYIIVLTVSRITFFLTEIAISRFSFFCCPTEYSHCQLTKTETISGKKHWKGLVGHGGRRAAWVRVVHSENATNNTIYNLRFKGIQELSIRYAQALKIFLSSSARNFKHVPHWEQKKMCLFSSWVRYGSVWVSQSMVHKHLALSFSYHLLWLCHRNLCMSWDNHKTSSRRTTPCLRTLRPSRGQCRDF